MKTRKRVLRNENERQRNLERRARLTSFDLDRYRIRQIHSRISQVRGSYSRKGVRLETACRDN